MSRAGVSVKHNLARRIRPIRSKTSRLSAFSHLASFSHKIYRTLPYWQRCDVGASVNSVAVGNFFGRLHQRRRQETINTLVHQDTEAKQISFLFFCLVPV
jgi:hypothetical protein